MSDAMPYDEYVTSVIRFVPNVVLPMDIARYNRSAWDAQVNARNRWTIPISSEAIAAASKGDWSIVLTPSQPVPRDWFPPLGGCDVLCLAGGGGQQTPILAAAGANVTVFDNSPKQLQQDQLVADRDGLQINTVLGDMRDLSKLADESFDLVFNPCSVSFIPDVEPMFREVYRVLRPGGVFMAGFVNPVRMIFDEEDYNAGKLTVRHRLPYSDETHLTEKEKQKFVDDCEPFMFSHSLESLIAGQIRVGLELTNLFEDTSPDDKLSEFMTPYFATRAAKA